MSRFERIVRVRGIEAQATRRRLAEAEAEVRALRDKAARVADLALEDTTATAGAEWRLRLLAASDLLDAAADDAGGSVAVARQAHARARVAERIAEELDTRARAALATAREKRLASAVPVVRR